MRRVLAAGKADFPPEHRLPCGPTKLGCTESLAGLPTFKFAAVASTLFGPKLVEPHASAEIGEELARRLQIQ
jgi:hypothetical protein